MPGNASLLQIIQKIHQRPPALCTVDKMLIVSLISNSTSDLVATCVNLLSKYPLLQLQLAAFLATCIILSFELSLPVLLGSTQKKLFQKGTIEYNSNASKEVSETKVKDFPLMNLRLAETFKAAVNNGKRSRNLTATKQQDESVANAPETAPVLNFSRHRQHTILVPNIVTSMESSAFVSRGIRYSTTGGQPSVAEIQEHPSIFQRLTEIKRHGVQNMKNTGIFSRESMFQQQDGPFSIGKKRNTSFQGNSFNLVGSVFGN